MILRMSWKNRSYWVHVDIATSGDPTVRIVRERSSWPHPIVEDTTLAEFEARKDEFIGDLEKRGYKYQGYRQLPGTNEDTPSPEAIVAAEANLCPGKIDKEVEDGACGSDAAIE